MRKAFAISFFALCLMPTVQMLLHIVPEPGVDENRKLNPRPTRFTAPELWLKTANDWYADHFGFRSFLIRSKAQIDYSLFGTSDRVLVGRQGQLFYRATVNVEEPGAEEYLAGHLLDVERGIAEFANDLHDAHIGFVVVINPMTDYFYPELLPESASHRPASPRIDALMNDLRATPNVELVDTVAILRQTMNERRIFHRTDFHWNDPAAFPVAREIVGRIAEREGFAGNPWSHDLQIEYTPEIGGIARFMPVFSPPAESALHVRKNWTMPAGFHYEARRDPFEEITVAFPDRTHLLPATVFVGDSFFDGILRSGIEAYFESTWRIRWKPGMKISRVATDIPEGTRWVVVQFIEVSMTALLAFADRDDIRLARTSLHSWKPGDSPGRDKK